MLQKTITSLFNSMETKPVPFQPADVMEAFRKVDRILDSAKLPEHIETAERLFANMLSRYGFSETDRASPLIVGMQDRINQMRAKWEDMDRVAA